MLAITFIGSAIFIVVFPIASAAADGGAAAPAAACEALVHLFPEEEGFTGAVVAASTTGAAADCPPATVVRAPDADFLVSFAVEGFFAPATIVAASTTRHAAAQVAGARLGLTAPVVAGHFAIFSPAVCSRFLWI